MIPAYIFDLDGTLANNNHRQHLIEHTPKQWDTYFDACDKDTPYPDVITLLQTLRQHTTVIILSGRSDSCRMKTQEWILNHVGGGIPLFMRPSKDHRPDDILKESLYRKYIAPFYEVLGIFDDRNRVVAMWRRLGLRCYQVQLGDF